MPSSTFIFTTTPLPKDSVALASLIPDKRSPDQDALQQIQVQLTDFSISDDMDFKGRMDAQSDTLFKYEKSDNFHVTASLARNYILRQSQLMFEKLCKEETVKIWLEKNFKRNPKIYFVVGHRTLLDAKLPQKEQHNAEISGRARAPIGAAVDLTPTGKLDLEVGEGQEKTASGEAGFEAAGECIFAIGYRRVGFKSHKGVDSASLLGSHWFSFSKSREKGPEEEVVEVDIESEDDGEGDFAYMSSLLPRRVRRSLLT